MTLAIRASRLERMLGGGRSPSSLAELRGAVAGLQSGMQSGMLADLRRAVDGIRGAVGAFDPQVEQMLVHFESMVAGSGGCRRWRAETRRPKTRRTQRDLRIAPWGDRPERRWRAETRRAQREERIAIWAEHENELTSYRRAYWEGWARGASKEELAAIVRAEIEAESRLYEIEVRLYREQRRVLRAGPQEGVQ